MIKKISEEDFLLIRKRVNTSVVADIQQFVDGQDSACEIGIDDYKSCHSAYGAYRTAAKRGNFPVGFCVRGDRLFMYREVQ